MGVGFRHEGIQTFEDLQKLKVMLVSLATKAQASSVPTNYQWSSEMRSRVTVGIVIMQLSQRSRSGRNFVY
jgi:hypothetical protein